MYEIQVPVTPLGSLDPTSRRYPMELDAEKSHAIRTAHVYSARRQRMLMSDEWADKAWEIFRHQYIARAASSELKRYREAMADLTEVYEVEPWAFGIDAVVLYAVKPRNYSVAVLNMKKTQSSIYHLGAHRHRNDDGSIDTIGIMHHICNRATMNPYVGVYAAFNPCNTMSSHVLIQQGAAEIARACSVGIELVAEFNEQYLLVDLERARDQARELAGPRAASF